MRVKSVLTCIAVATFYLVYMTGCSSTKFVTVTTDPKEAVIYLDGQKVGTGKYEKQLDFSKVKSYEFTAQMEKFAPATVTVTKDPAEQTEYPIKLERIYSIPMPLYDFEATKTRVGLKLGFIQKKTISYFDFLEKTRKGLTLVTGNKSQNAYLGGPALSPVADALVYRVYDAKAKTSFVYKQQVDAKGKTPLIAESKALAIAPSFSNDGKDVLFASNRLGPQYGLWKYQTRFTRYPSNMTEMLSASMTSDGSRIAYTAYPQGSEALQVWTMATTNNERTQICEGFDPQISPDGSKILFVRLDKSSGVPQLWLVDTEGSANESQLTTNTDYSVRDPRWAPNGKAIVFASNEGKDDKDRRNWDIWMMDADGKNKTQLTTNGSHDDKPCFDRHGEHIYFRSNRGTMWNIWRFKLDKSYSNKRRAFEAR